MASPGPRPPPAKKAKLGIDSRRDSALLYELPKQHSVVELYNPHMVEITVTDHSRSEYFSKLFSGHVSEGGMGAVELEDVGTNVFRCFIGWMYCHRIFYEQVETSELQSLSAQNHYGNPKKESQKEAHEKSSVQEVKGSQTDAKGHTDTAELFESKQQRDPIATSGSVGEDNGLSGISGVDIDQRPKRTEAKDSSRGPLTSATVDRPIDKNDPVTWTWLTLFHLYVFADKYSARSFRMEIFKIIQTKFHIKNPQSYKVPSYKDIGFAAENLPASSPLCRFLADICGILTTLPNDGHKQAGGFNELPASFLSACLVTAKRHHFAQLCSECHAGVPHSEASAHTQEDLKAVRTRDPCSYHEHGEDQEEAARCALQWESRKFLFRPPVSTDSQGTKRGPRD